MSNYSISKAFEEIEKKLIQSMKRNLTRHLNEEKDEDMNWSMWQAEQLKSLEQFKKDNKSLFKDDFSTINDDISELLEKTFDDSRLNLENEILNAIMNGDFKTSTSSTITGNFFKINQKKLKALISETQENMKTAETSILRYTDDQYRQIIYNAQVYANTGAGTVAQAVDMATKSFLEAGINSIEYKDGRRVNIKSYAQMAIQTANTRAKLWGEGSKRDEWGIHTVLVPNRRWRLSFMH